MKERVLLLNFLSLSLPMKLIRGPIMNDKKNIETVRFVKLWRERERDVK